MGEGPRIYYVAKEGNDNNPGTEELPWLTISKAATVAKAGDTVYIKKGTYEETVIPKNSGTVDKRIIFSDYETDLVIVQGTKGYGFYLGPGIDYITVRGLTITRGIGAGAVTDYPKATDIDIAHGAGIKIMASVGNEIKNNVIYDNDIGVFLSEGMRDDEPFASTDNSIIHNTIYNNGEAGIRNKRSDNTLIFDNTIYHNGFPSNPVYDEPAAGITYYCAIGTVISNNTIYDNSNSAIQNYAGTYPEDCDSEDTVIKNNVLSQTNPSPLEGRTYTGKKIVLDIADKEIIDLSNVYRYNIFYNGELDSEIIAWGTNNFGDEGELLTFEEFVEKILDLNPDSVGNQQVTSLEI